MKQPIRPDEVEAKQQELIEDSIFDAVNTMIALTFDGKKAHFSLEDLLDKHNELFPNTKKYDLDEFPILLIRSMYSKAGWRVDVRYLPETKKIESFTFSIPNSK